MRKRGVAGWLSLVARVIIRAAGFFATYVCLTGMLVLVISDPILRYVVGSPLYWSNEVSTFLMMEMAFAGLGIALAKGKHVRVTLIFNKLPRKARDVLWIIISLFTMFFAGIITYSMMKLAFSSLEYGAVTPTGELAFFPWQMVAALGLMVFLVAIIAFTVRRTAIALALEEEMEEGKALIDLEY